MELKIANPFLQEYLRYVEDTESPRLYHIWSAISGIGASLGRRVYFPFGTGPIYPNEYVLLVGPPATRKSTAINLAGNLVRKATNIRIAPEDTAGKRQGLIAAMEDKSEEERTAEDIEFADAATFLANIADHKISIDLCDKHILYALASEFNIFIGQNSLEMINFLTKVYDGEDYTYKIKTQMSELKEPLMSILGGTTPTSIAEAFPSETIGQGLMSRIILVFGNQKYKRVARPKAMDKDIEKYLKDTLNYVYHEMRGEIAETNVATRMIAEIYDEEVEINDPRFVYYCDRRQAHHIKLCVTLAAARRSMVIEAQDVEEAHSILKYTEQFMPDALGEFGLSPLASAKQKLLEFIQHNSGTPILQKLLVSVMNRDMRQVEVLNSLREFEQQGKINRFDSDIGTVYLFNDKEKQVLDMLSKDGNNGSIGEGTSTVSEIGRIKFRFNSGD